MKSSTTHHEVRRADAASTGQHAHLGGTGLVAAALALAALAARVRRPVPAQADPRLPIDLCAKAGTVDLLAGGASVPIWGFASKPLGSPALTRREAGLPGPVLDATAGESVEVTSPTISPSRSRSTSPGDLDSGPTEAAPGGAATYTFTAVARDLRLPERRQRRAPGRDGPLRRAGGPPDYARAGLRRRVDRLRQRDGRWS